MKYFIHLSLKYFFPFSVLFLFSFWYSHYTHVRSLVLHLRSPILCSLVFFLLFFKLDDLFWFFFRLTDFSYAVSSLLLSPSHEYFISGDVIFSYRISIWLFVISISMLRFHTCLLFIFSIKSLNIFIMATFTSLSVNFITRSSLCLWMKFYRNTTMLVICIFLWLFSRSITVLGDWARDCMTLSLKYILSDLVRNFCQSLLWISCTWGHDAFCYHMTFLLPQEVLHGAWQGLPHWLGWNSKAFQRWAVSGVSTQRSVLQKGLFMGPCGDLLWYAYPCPQPWICWELSWRLLGTPVCSSLTSVRCPTHCRLAAALSFSLCLFCSEGCSALLGFASWPRRFGRFFKAKHQGGRAAHVWASFPQVLSPMLPGVQRLKIIAIFICHL